jgi:hypothetical protein
VAVGEPQAEGAPLELTAVVTAWKQVLKSLEGQSKMTAAILKEANPVAVDGNRISLGFNYTFHYKRISQDAASVSLVEEHFSRVVGQTVVVKCFDHSEAKTNGDQSASTAKSSSKPAPKDDELTRRAAQLFNARIVD